MSGAPSSASVGGRPTGGAAAGRPAAANTNNTNAAGANNSQAPRPQMQRTLSNGKSANGANPAAPRPAPLQTAPQQQQQRQPPQASPTSRPSPLARAATTANVTTVPATSSSAAAATAPRRPLSTHSSSPSPTPTPPTERVIEMEDDIPLVAEVFENQRYYPVVGWSAKLMDRPSWSNAEGTEEKTKDDFKVPPGWSWAGEWAVDIEDGPNGHTDADGWSYASDFTRRYRGSSDASLKAVRRRRHFRRRVPPAKSVKVALGLAGGPKTNALTVGLAKNKLAVAYTNSVRSANGYSVMGASTLTSRYGSGAGSGKPAGNPSLAELYAKFSVDSPATGDGAATGAASESSVVGEGALDTTGVRRGSTSTNGIGTPSSVHSSASATLTASSAAALLAGSASSIDSPTLKPKFSPFSSLSSLASGSDGALGLETFSTFRPKKLEKAMVQLWEMQRYYPIAGWSARMLPTDNKGKGGWINEADGKKCSPKEFFSLTPDWCWTMPTWLSVVDSRTDSEGWSYAIDPTLGFHPRKGIEHFVRRRMWQREKQQRGAQTDPKKTYTAFFERLEHLKRDLRAEEADDDLVSLTSATW